MNIDYAAIADQAVGIIGSADPLQYQAAFDQMASETKTIQKTGEVRMNDREIVAALGKIVAYPILDALEFVLVPREIRWLQGDGLDLNNADVKAFVGTLDQSTQDAVNALLVDTVLSWPGLKSGYVHDALQMRQAGAV